MSDLEAAAEKILLLWEMRQLCVTNALSIPEVTQAFMEFRDALRDVRMERLNHHLSANAASKEIAGF